MEIGIKGQIVTKLVEEYGLSLAATTRQSGCLPRRLLNG
jgi:hypothetical protein